MVIVIYHIPVHQCSYQEISPYSRVTVAEAVSTMVIIRIIILIGIKVTVTIVIVRIIVTMLIMIIEGDQLYSSLLEFTY